MYNEELIREAVDIATGDDGRTSAEVMAVYDCDDIKWEHVSDHETIDVEELL